jgi:arsenite methyltransferase
MFKKKIKARMLNRKASSPRNKPDHVLGALALRPGDHVADIGVGGGYFSMRFADAVGERGRVYAVDRDPDFLALLRKTAAKKGVNNLTLLPADAMASNIPARSLDCVFFRNVYHHLHDRVVYIKSVSGLLKPDGRIAIVEYTEKSTGQPAGHFVPPSVIIDEMNEAGFGLEKSYDVLQPRQSYAIFSKKS